MRERIQQMIYNLNEKVGVHWTNEDKLKFAELLIRERIEEIDTLVAAEREACAKIVDPSEEHRRDASWGYLGGTEGVKLLDVLAAEIRARSKNEAK